VLGVVGLDAVGLEGLELHYNKYIQGKPQTLLWARDAKGKRLYPRVEKSLERGEQGLNLVTTIDSRIQYVVERKLKEVVREKGHGAATSLSWIQRPGRSWPWPTNRSFDPNSISKTDLDSIKIELFLIVTIRALRSSPFSSLPPWKNGL